MHRYIKWVAMLRSIAWVSIYAATLGVWIMFSGPYSHPSLLQAPLHLIGYLFIYLGYSLVMWVIYGLPMHWVIQKYGNGALVYYILAAIIWIVFLSYDKTSLNNIMKAIVIGIPAIIQAIIFKYYFDNESIQYASRQRANKKT
jgi:hypothetical protein